MKKSSILISLIALSSILISTPSCQETNSEDPTPVIEHSGKIKRIEQVDTFAGGLSYDFSYSNGQLTTITLAIDNDDQIHYEIGYEDGYARQLSLPEFNLYLERQDKGDSVVFSPMNEPNEVAYSLKRDGDNITSYTFYYNSGPIYEQHLIEYEGAQASKYLTNSYSEDGKLQGTREYLLSYNNVNSPLYFNLDVRACLLPVLANGLERLFLLSPSIPIENIYSYFSPPDFSIDGISSYEYIYDSNGKPIELLLNGDPWLKMSYYE